MKFFQVGEDGQQEIQTTFSKGQDRSPWGSYVFFLIGQISWPLLGTIVRMGCKDINEEHFPHICNYFLCGNFASGSLLISLFSQCKLTFFYGHHLPTKPFPAPFLSLCPLPSKSFKLFISSLWLRRDGTFTQISVPDPKSIITDPNPENEN